MDKKENDLKLEVKKLPPKPTYVAPNKTEYWLDPRGFVRRIDIRGLSRKEAKENKRAAKKERIKMLKARKD